MLAEFLIDSESSALFAFMPPNKTKLSKVLIERNKNTILRSYKNLYYYALENIRKIMAERRELSYSMGLPISDIFITIKSAKCLNIIIPASSSFEEKGTRGDIVYFIKVAKSVKLLKVENEKISELINDILTYSDDFEEFDSKNIDIGSIIRFIPLPNKEDLLYILEANYGELYNADIPYFTLDYLNKIYRGMFLLLK